MSGPLRKIWPLRCAGDGNCSVGLRRRWLPGQPGRARAPMTLRAAGAYKRPSSLCFLSSSSFFLQWGLGNSSKVKLLILTQLFGFLPCSFADIQLAWFWPLAEAQFLEKKGSPYCTASELPIHLCLFVEQLALSRLWRKSCGLCHTLWWSGRRSAGPPSKPRSHSSSSLSCVEGIRPALMSRVGSENGVLAVVRCLARRRLPSRPHGLPVVAIATSAAASLDACASAKHWTAT